MDFKIKNIKKGDRLGLLVLGMAFVCLVYIGLPAWQKHGFLLSNFDAVSEIDWRTTIALLVETLTLSIAVVGLLIKFLNLIEKINEEDIQDTEDYEDPHHFV